MRVLVVEDDDTTAQSIELMLRSAGMVVDAADTGEDGLEIGKLYDYDLIILDLMLPDMHGMDVLRRLRDSPGGDAGSDPFRTHRVRDEGQGLGDRRRRLSDQTL